MLESVLEKKRNILIEFIKYFSNYFDFCLTFFNSHEELTQRFSTTNNI